MVTEAFDCRDGSEPFVEVRTKDGGGLSVIEFVPGDVPQSERRAVITRMLEDAREAIDAALAHHRAHAAPGQRQEYSPGPRGCRNCKRARDEHDFWCPECKRTLTSSVCRAHAPVIVGLARCCGASALADS